MMPFLSKVFPLTRVRSKDLIVVIVALLSVPVLASDNVRKAPPNIIFILADDLGYGDLGCYGNPYIKTPNLDRLAQEGTVYRQFYAASAVCSPSRAAFLTGRYPARLGIHGHLSSHENNAAREMPDWLDPKVLNLPQRLKQNGYKTAHFGKWHLGPESKTRVGDRPIPQDYGWDVFVGRRAFGTKEFEWEPENRTYDPYFRANSTGQYVDSALEFIENNRGAPFYIQIWTLVPHAPLKPTPEELAEYDSIAIDWERFDERMQRYSGGAEDRDRQFKTYAASVTGMDKQIGRLIGRLEEMGLSENTLIIFASDNGPEDIDIENAKNAGMGDTGGFRGRKRSNYEGGIRVPLIVSWPGRIPAGRVDSDSVIGAVDFLPTLSAIAGVPLYGVGKACDGEDVSGAIWGGRHQRYQPLFWEWRYAVSGLPENKPPQLAIRKGDWKYFMNPDGTGRELYNIRHDPRESRNLSEELTDCASEYERVLYEWRGELN